MELTNGVATAWKAVVGILLLVFRVPVIDKALEVGVPGGLSLLRSRDYLYNRTWALYLVEYAAAVMPKPAVYIEDSARLMAWNCSRCHGLTKNFKITALVIDEPRCLQSYVGVAEDLRAIVIAFRGTQETSYQNWAEDLYFRQLDLNYPGIANAMVHKGFYQAYHNTTVRDSVINAVQSIVKQRSDLSIILTGHSMGGAMASFCALDLAANFGFTKMQVITFGQPRIGNSIFAAAYSALVPDTIRMTHSHDIVPHLPPYYTLMAERTYHHFATEVWIFKIQIGRLQYEFERVCDSSGEDPSCSRSVSGNSIADHLQYLGVFLRTVDE